MNKLLNDLNEKQREAAEALEGTILVLAGAGSGKTRVLTSRICNLIEKGVQPHEIMAVTFTNKAAREMTERLEALIGEEKAKNLWVGTFHGICVRILKADVENYKSKSGKNWNKNFVIFAEDDSNSLIKKIIKDMGLDDKIYAPKLIKSIISLEKNKLKTAIDYEMSARDTKSKYIAAIFRKYEEELLKNNAFDFDDLLLVTVNLLKNSKEAREKYFKRFKHILTDEFQDTNASQYKLIKSIYTNDEEPQEKGRSLFVVGDVDQSIYSWRGADYRIILNFQSDFRNTKLIKLEKNYRSTQNILNAANAIIENNVQRLEKSLYSTKGHGKKILCYEALNERGEAKFIINNIISKGFGYKDVAILYRTNTQSRILEEQFMSAGIPYQMVGGFKFYDRKEIKDIAAYLKILYNSDDGQSVKRIINAPKRSIGKTTLEKIDKISQDRGVSFYQAIKEAGESEDLKKQKLKALQDFTNVIEQLKQELYDYSLGDLIIRIVERTGYLSELEEENTEDAKIRIENIREFVGAAREFERKAYTLEDRTALGVLGEFLAQIALVSDVDSIEEDKNKVTLMTLHAAKGLEFPVVFLAGLEEELFPHIRSIRDNAQMEEERRLMYVGVTRAQEELYISYAQKRMIWGDLKYPKPSRFIQEIPKELFEFKSAVDKFRRVEDFSSPYNSSAERMYRQKENDYDGIAPQAKVVSFGKNFKLPKVSYSKPVQEMEAKKEEIKTVSGVSLGISKPQETPRPANIEMFNVGDKVSHANYGEGVVKQIMEFGKDKMYIADFGENGKKALDYRFSGLTKV